MATAFQLKTYPEILANMFATAKVLLGTDIDLNRGAFLRTVLECAALQDADQYVQVSRLLDLFSLDTAKGDDLDQRAEDFGSEVFTGLRRNAARSSISSVSVSDGTLLISSTLSTDVTIGSSSFSVTSGEGTNFPSSGNVVLERGTEREEQIVFTRVGDTFTLVSPTSTQFGHLQAGEVLLVAVKSTLASTVALGAGTATLVTGTGAAWGASGSVIFERSTTRREKLTFTRSGDVLTLGGTTAFEHLAGTAVYESTTTSDRAISTGTVVYAPATEGTAQVNFSTLSAGTLYDGDYTSELIPVESEAVGADTKVGSNTITRFNTAPFSGATVTNSIPATRGADRETDDAYRFRIRDYIQSLSRGTALAIETLVAGLRDETTNEEVSFAQIIEPVNPGESLLYISDGTSTFGLSQEAFLGRDVLISVAETGDRRGKLAKFAPYAMVETPAASRTPRLFKSSERGSATSVGTNYLEDTSKALTINAYVGYYLKTDDDQFYEITANTAIRYTIDAGGATPSLGSYSVYDFTADPLTPGTDYDFNETNGDVELSVANALAEHDGLVAASDNASPGVGAYTHTTGLGATVQRTINGDPTDFDTYPGYKCTGTKIRVTTPTIVSPSFQVQIVAARGVADVDLAPTAKTLTVTTVNSLGIGDNIVLSEIIRVIKGTPGVDDVKMISPSTNVTVLDGQLARITEDNVTIL